MKDTHVQPANDNSELLKRVSLGLAKLKGMNDTAPVSEQGFAIQFDEWDWEVGVGLYGLFRHAEQAADSELIAAIAAWYDWQISRGLPPRQVNSSSPLLALGKLLDHVDRPDWDALVQDWADWLMTGLARTEDGGFQHVVKERANDGQLWDDTLFMTCLFLADAGKRFGRADWVDEAIHQFLVHARYLSNPVTGLWYHGWTFEGRHNFAEAFWGRGNCWVTVAIPELFGILGDAIPPFARAFLTSVFRAQVDTLAGCQLPDGMFTTLLDDPASPPETSATAGFAYGILRAIDLGMLDAGYRDIATRAHDAVVQRIGADGIVLEVSDGTPMGHDLDFYRRIPNVPAPYGQALVMLLLVEVAGQQTQPAPQTRASAHAG